jgi:adenine-specific DNA-methyltransferase
MSKSAILGASLFQEKMMPSLIDEYDKKVPHIIKYMGSKRSILEFVIKEINNVYTGGKLCDLFAGTSILAGALGRSIPIHSNDIQEYSAILAKTYLANYDSDIDPTTVLNSITSRAQEYVDFFKEKKPGLAFSYADEMSVNEFVELENQQQQLIDLEFKGISHHLFVKYYSGTYWSYQQCLWIDALRKVADEYQNTPFYYLILSSLMYAMSYNSQSTGHYAQFRDATSLSSKTDILIYRKKRNTPLFYFKIHPTQ